VATGAIFAAAVPTALAIWAVIPDRVFTPAPVVVDEHEPAAPPILTEAQQTEVIRLLVELAAITALGLAAIIALGRFMKRWRTRRPPVPIDLLGETPEVELWELPPKPRRRVHRGRSVRERIIAAYLNATGAMAGRGWEFPEAMTAREFLAQARERAFLGRASLGALTSLFERAKYSSQALTDEALHDAESSARGVSEAVKS
jgi:hypothetical protein